jgi:cysteine sulfinate desulfinase/cysteine desulfurase-like protein
MVVYNYQTMSMPSNFEESLSMEKARMSRNNKRMKHTQQIREIDEQLLTKICEIENFKYENDQLRRRNNLLTFQLSNLYYKTRHITNQGGVPLATISPDGYLFITE